MVSKYIPKFLNCREMTPRSRTSRTTCWSSFKLVDAIKTTVCRIIEPLNDKHFALPLKLDIKFVSMAVEDMQFSINQTRKTTQNIIMTMFCPLKLGDSVMVTLPSINDNYHGNLDFDWLLSPVYHGCCHWWQSYHQCWVLCNGPCSSSYKRVVVDYK